MSALSLQRRAVAPGAAGADWAAVATWLDTVRLNGGPDRQGTATTYAFHVAKLRWFCEKELGRSPAAWEQEHANAFVRFLRDLPDHALCARVDTGRRKRLAHGADAPVVRWAGPGETGYTPFRAAPAAGTCEDILRCVRSIFAYLNAEGLLARDPMARLKVRKRRRIDASRALDLDLYAMVLDSLDHRPAGGEHDRRLRERDRFALVALREMAPRASELIGARMTDLDRVLDPRNGRTYWILRIDERNAKGGVARTVPVTQPAMDALIAYRKAFGLSALPQEGERYGLLLSTRTAPMEIHGALLTETRSRRYFKAWASLTSRKSLYQIVKSRLEDAAAYLMECGRPSDAARLRRASPHWLRHTFATAAVAKGRDIRVIAQSLGHADISMTMAYTVQESLDQIRAYEAEDGTHVAGG